MANTALFTFQELIDAFYFGVEDEASRVNPPLPYELDRAGISDYLTRAYHDRYEKRATVLPANTVECAKLLGRITFAMFRSESRPQGDPVLPEDDPIDGVTNPPVVTVEHVGRAREMYGHYSNRQQMPAPKNVILGPVHLPGDRDGFRETNEPCPLCG